MNEACIICRNATFNYDGKTAASNISFTVENGDYLFILGENGTGKSTVVKGLLGLIKPVSGEIEYVGVKKNQIGYLPQTSAIPDGFPASCFEVVMQGRGGKRLFFSSEDKKIAEKNMKILGISDLKKERFSSLSGGQKQRVLLARALSATEKVLLLDEPVSGLDPLVTAEMYDIIEKLNREHGISVVMISHDAGAASKYASHILHLKNRVMFCGTADDYLKTDLSNEFLGGCGHEHH